jgi:predicted TIM-barrel enzyme
MKKLFNGKNKILMGMIPLRPLPASPRWKGDLDASRASRVTVQSKSEQLMK